MGRGSPTSRSLGGTGKKRGKVRVSFLARSPPWEWDSGETGGQQGAGRAGLCSHHLMRVKVEVPTLRARGVSRVGGRAGG